MAKRPDLARATVAFNRLLNIIADLRHPDTGCPWDLKQDHQSLRRYMIEEAYEATEAMTAGIPSALAEELGDVLLQVVLNAQVALDQATFDIVDVIDGISDKMLRRHPHVFGNEEERSMRKIEQIATKWGEIKAAEVQTAESKSSTIYGDAKIEKIHPATRQAAEIGKIARKINFDWQSPTEVFDKLLSEVAELKEAWEEAGLAPSSAVRAELGDVYFTLAQFCRHLQLDPEVIAWDGNRKFLQRFIKLEQIAAARGISVGTCRQEVLEQLWIEAKDSE